MKITEEDVLFIEENRKKILRFLRDKKSYESTRKISEETKINMGTVGFHCGELLKRNMVDKKIVRRKAMWKITEKGLIVIQEVDKREKGEVVG
jgi:predicted transcriptional regulator